jgi:two-component system OmpR family sensor kinase
VDGFKKRLNESVQLKLSFSLSLAIFIVALVAGIFSFVSAFNEAHDLQDDMLRQVAALFERRHLPVAHPGEDGRVKDSDEETRVIVQYLDEGNKVAGDVDAGAPLPLPITLPDGLHTVDVNGEPYRVLVKTTNSTARIAVAQETGVRDDIARASALRTLMPFLVLVPVLLLLVANLIRQMFRPIASLSAEIDQRAEQDLHPVMESQRRFVADAAHELRSPLTAMSLQAERLAEAEMSDLARERLMALRRGIERGRSLLDQLLTLAQAQAALRRPKSSVSVQHVYRRVLEDLMPLAEAKKIDIGVQGNQDARVLVNEPDLVAIVQNLVHNAISYTPDGGTVDLSVTMNGGHAILRIQDSGPGIQVAERERVFDPFYRTLGSDQVGSGLGLSIVRTITNRIGAGIQLGFSNEVKRSGLCVSVCVPIVKEIKI